MDFVVSRIRVLQENFIETAPASVYDLVLGSGIPGPPSTRPKGGVARDGLKSVSLGDDGFMDRIYDPQSGSGSGVEGNVEGGMTGTGEGTNEGGAGQDGIDAVSGGENTVSEREELPVLTMETINIIGSTLSNTLSVTHPTSTSTSSSTSIPTSTTMPVTVVDDLPTILLFAAAVRSLSRQASSSGSAMEGEISITFFSASFTSFYIICAYALFVHR